MTEQTFHRWLLILMCIAALSAAQRDDRLGALSVTRVDDLVITGGTDATGVVTARAGVRLADPAVGPLFSSGSGAPAFTAPRGSLYLQTDTAAVYQNTDGATTWAPVASASGTTQTNNLQVGGTTDAVGVVTARAGVRLMTPASGPLLSSGTGVPAGTGAQGSLYMRTDVAQVYQNTDGATAWSQLGGGGGIPVFSGVWAHNDTHGAIAVTTNTTTPLSLQDETYDTGNYHSTSSNQTLFYPPTNGYYMIVGSFRWNDINGTPGWVEMSILLNGFPALCLDTQYSAVALKTFVQQCTAITYMTTTDYIRMTASQQSGATVNVNVTKEYGVRMTRLGS